MKRIDFIKSLFVAPFIKGIDLDDTNMFSHMLNYEDIEPSIFSHWHEDIGSNPSNVKESKSPQCSKSKIVNHYSPGKWTPFGPLRQDNEDRTGNS